jgi:4-amino-4-deoxy-L-arabinose transferase-like glycosyltransferase
MLLLVVMLYCYTKAVLSEPGWKVFCWLCLFGVAASAAFSVKVTVFILFIAVFACLLLQKKSWKKIIAGIVIVATVAAARNLKNIFMSYLLDINTKA